MERMSLTEVTVNNIRRIIESGEYAVGTKLPTEQRLCEKFGVGRSTVREALRILETQGYTEIRPGKGAFVASLNPSKRKTVTAWFSSHHIELLDFMDVRIALEPLAVKLAIERAQKDELENIRLIFEEFKNEIEAGRTDSLPELDERFHTAIIKATHNKLMVSLNKSISASFKEYRSKAFVDLEIAQHALAPHEEITNALINHDVERGERAMLEHLEISLKDINGK